MASSNTGSEDDCFEVLDCTEFYPKFLDPISEDVRKELITVIHELTKSDACSDNARERCEEILIKVEQELQVDNFICEIVARELSECLRKLSLVTEAVDFMYCRLERMKTRDFGSLMILGSIYDLSGDYKSALSFRNEALKLAELEGDRILISLALAKQACAFWHLHRPEEVKRNVTLCLGHLNDSNITTTVGHFPFSESIHRILDLYKTLGYIHSFLDRSKSTQYYVKALSIFEQDTNAIVQIFKIETHIACQYNNINMESEARKNALSAYKKMQDLKENQKFMNHHSLTIMHAMSRVAHSLPKTEQTLVLQIREDLYSIAKKYLSENHPEIARTAADIAYLYNMAGQEQKELEYIDRAKSTLESIHDNLDTEFLKLHVREISDAWKTLAQLFSVKRDFKEAEKSFKEAIQVNIRVYGLNHPRLARIYCSFAHLYKRFDRFSEAVVWFTKCKDINDEFAPNDAELRNKNNRQIQICKSLERRTLK